MGLNAFFAYTIVLQTRCRGRRRSVSCSGRHLFLAHLSDAARERIATAIPGEPAPGDGGRDRLLLTFIGLRNAGLIEPDAATMVRLARSTPGGALLGRLVTQWC
jgi:AGZA family xanthine/uracil permease-like MFS transporter